MTIHHRHVWPIVSKSVRKTYRRPLRVLADEPMGPHKREHSRRTYGRREPLPLAISSTGAVVAYACGTCGTVHSGKLHGLDHARERAVMCCHHRDRCSGCGAEIDRQRSRCNDCWSRDSFKRTQARARAATVIVDNGEPVCCDNSEGEWGDGYSSCLAAHLDWWDAEQGGWANTGEADDVWIVPPPPPFVFATTPCVVEISQQQIDESMMDDLHEDFDVTDLNGYDELCAAVERFNARQSVASYMVDYSRVIVIDAERFAAYLDEAWDGRPDVRRKSIDPARIPVSPPRFACDIAAEAAARTTAQREVTP